MDNLWKYHLTVTLPLVAIFALYIWDHLDTGVFVLLIMGYTFAFRPYIDYLRLEAKGIVQKGDFWKVWNPLFRFRHYQTLMFK